ncbi:hypothetical protein KHQ81_06380 [Mycoplasmatota bacterium]|nr:hypothetical protein KHQ81_06380 [Mycoplasmatota bacterium]
MINSIIKSGGGNIKDGKIIEYNDGYMVGYSTIAIESKEKMIEHFPKYVQLSNQKNVGFWYNNNDGLWYVDFSENIESYIIALILAMTRGEKAIWDCHNLAEIKVAE